MEEKKIRLKCNTSGVAKFAADGSVEAKVFDLTWDTTEFAGLTQEQQSIAVAAFFREVQRMLLGMKAEKPSAEELVRKVGEQQTNLINSPTARGYVRTIEVPHYTVASANTGPRTVGMIHADPPDDDEGECDTPLVVE